MSEFKKKVLQVVKMIPYGKVASYGQVALLVGVPRGARLIGGILSSGSEGATKEEVPWWRVVNNEGRVSIKGRPDWALLQRKNLEKEGIRFSEKDTFDIEKYRFRLSVEELQELSLDDEYIEKVISKYL